MTVSYQDFTTAFPEFSNPSTFPQATAEFWLSQAYNQLNPRVFGAQMDMAVLLFTAHNIVLAAQSARVSSGGGIGGASGGVVASKSVADVSVSYDTTLTSIEGAGLWNATTYGQRLYQMMQANAGPYYFAGQPRNFGGYRGF